jgi:membrane fusion protein (multidrug efflux system)
VSELQGSYQVGVVTPENKVEIRPVTVGERVGSQWIIAKGLKPGEKVVVEGLQKLKAGDSVRPLPSGTEPQTVPDTPAEQAEPSPQPEPSPKDN